MINLIHTHLWYIFWTFDSGFLDPETRTYHLQNLGRETRPPPPFGGKSKRLKAQYLYW